jgi:cytochrome P450
MTETPEAERFGADYFQNPLAVYARLRDSRPVTPVIMPEGARQWLVTRYEDVRSALADPRLAKDRMKHMVPEDRTPDPVNMYLNRHMLSMDPPDHTRLRRLVVKAFTPRRVAGLRPRILAITSSLLDALDARDKVDLIEAFAFPLPVTVICELLGVPAADQDKFQAWSHAVLSSAARPGETREAGFAMYSYFTELVAAKRKAPADDLLSALIAATDEGDSLDERELIGTMFLLMIAGHETTVNLIASGMLALLTFPAELARLEGEIAFGALLDRFPSMSLAVPPSSLRWRQSSLIHGLEELPVRLRP